LKISIITINYNDAAGLEKTIKSVISQTYKNIEYIVIDGDSGDDSKSILKRYEEQVDFSISEPDTGIYNAMNKGIAVAKGDYLLFINSGDVLLDSQVIEQAVLLELDKDLIYGNIVFVEGDKTRDWVVEDILSFETFYRSTIPHPATFIKRDLFQKIGVYSEDYRIVSDWEFFLLATCKYNCSYKHINLFLTKFFQDGISADPKNFLTLISERKAVLLKHFPLFVTDYEQYTQVKEDLRKVRKYVKAKKFVKGIFKK